MLKRIITSIIIIIVLILITNLMFEVIGSGKITKYVSARDLEISFKNGLAYFEETFYMNKNSYMSILKLQLQEKYLNADTTELYIDGRKIERHGVAFSKTKEPMERISYRKDDDGDIIINHIEGNLSEGNHKIVMKYYVLLSRISTEYNNVSIINIKYNDFAIYNNIKIKLPKETEKFKISNNKLSTEKIKNNEYIINAKEMRKSIDIAVDKGAIPCGNIIKEEYKKIEKEEKRVENIKNTIKIFLSAITSVTLINLIIIYVFNKSKKTDKEYHRETNDIIDVVYAETLIDEKVNSSKLIMSVIVDQISCGNIVMDNDNLLLNKYDDESEVKREIINMFFKKNNSINIRDLSKVFQNNQEIDEVIKKFKEIRKQITKKLYDIEIYDKNKKNLLQGIKKISIGIILTTIIYMLYILYGFKFTIISTILTTIICLPGVLFIKKCEIIHKTPMLAIPIIYFSVIIVGAIIINIKPLAAFSIKPVEILSTVLIIILNYIVIRMTKKHVFTKEGLEEYKKLQGLNDYILDYSLIQERDIETVVIWDKYLVYATAFGIPNKVTNKFSESLMNMTELLNKINKLSTSED